MHLSQHAPVKRGFPRKLAVAVVFFGIMVVSGCVSLTDTTYNDLVPAYSGAKVRPERSILVRIFKQESELEVWKLGADGRYALQKPHPLCRWSGKLGPKKAEGDRQAPEGFYSVTRAQMNPNSKFHRSFNLGYPNPLEKSLGYTGDSLMVHGACSSSGCFAMTDEGVGEVYAEVEKAFALGQSDFQVQSYPFRMTAVQMARHRLDPNIAFWRNLKRGYDVFEVTRKEPDVAACGGRYVFDARRPDGQPIAPDAACPPLEVRVAPEVASRRAEDAKTLQALLSEGRGGTPMSYIDGGMHPTFRDMLKRLGKKELASQTSQTAVQISRPDALVSPPAASTR